jgi:hypothetical protein
VAFFIVAAVKPPNLKYDLIIPVEVVWTGLMWLGIWTGGGMLLEEYWTFEYRKILGSS